MLSAWIQICPSNLNLVPWLPSTLGLAQFSQTRLGYGSHMRASTKDLPFLLAVATALFPSHFQPRVWG